MGRVLFVTGKLAAPLLHETLDRMPAPFERDVAVLGISVAALMTTEWVGRFLEVGPGVARDETVGAALLVRELDLHRGRWPVFLLPVECAELVRLAYRLGGRNVEMHAAQVRGESEPFRGVSFPTFMPETG